MCLPFVQCLCGISLYNDVLNYFEHVNCCMLWREEENKTARECDLAVLMVNVATCFNVARSTGAVNRRQNRN